MRKTGRRETIKLLSILALSVWNTSGVASSTQRTEFERVSIDIISVAIGDDLNENSVISAFGKYEKLVNSQFGQFFIKSNSVTVDADLNVSQTLKSKSESRIYIQPNHSSASSDICSRREVIEDALKASGFEMIRAGFVDTWLGYAGDILVNKERRIRVLVRYATTGNQCIALVQLYKTQE